MKRRAELVRRTPLRSRRPDHATAWNSTLRPRSHDRAERAFRRSYHSRQRVRAIQRMACLVPGCTRRSENAHVRAGGIGMKAGWRWIVNLCAWHHRLSSDSLHLLGSPERFREVHGVDLLEASLRLALVWEGRRGG